MTTSPARILYVCSAARCGSTLTDMFLGGHPQVASTGELSLIGKTLAQLIAAGVDWLTQSTVLEQAPSNRLALYDAIAGAWGRTPAVDTSERMHESAALARRRTKRVSILRATRDVRATNLSRRDSVHSGAERIAGRHDGYQRRALPLDSRLVPEQWMRMRYGDLAAGLAGQHIHIDERWCKEMIDARREYVQSHGAAMNRRLGYEDEAR
jgi:hypothetical protein